jgi:thiol-disulfide isomerase/thioredoxin
MRAFLAFLLCCLIPIASGKSLDVGGRAPAIAATLLDGSRFDSSAQPGKVVLVHFWATWCAPCREEMPALDAFYRAHRDEGLVVVAISLDSRGDLPKVEQAMRGMSYPAALLEDTQAKGYGRIWRVPLTFAMDRHGLLRRDGFASSPALDAAALDRDVLPLLHER